MGGLADGLAGPGAGIVCLVLSLFQSRPGLFSCCAESKPGRTALITLLEKAKDGIEGKTGTAIHL